MGEKGNFESTLLVKYHSTYGWPMFSGWKTLVEPQPMEHSRTRPKNAPYFVPEPLEPGLREDLVGWGTPMKEYKSLPLHLYDYILS
jgi:hypothetical protein